MAGAPTPMTTPKPSPEEEPGKDLEPAQPSDDERLFNELNLLRVEGYFFCFDPKASAKYTQKREFVERVKMLNEIVERPIVIEPNPNYGYPSVLAYKILQACMKKLSDHGYPVPDSVCFSQRELARLIGRKSFGGQDSQDIFQAAMQLYKTDIWCSFYDRATQEWQSGVMKIVSRVLFSGRQDRLHQCIFQIDRSIIKSLNHRHAFWINYQRVEGFEPITTALYKHLFFHFSNLFSQFKHKAFSYNKDYAAICTQWLGGLTVLRYKSKILNEQMGRHLELLQDRGLLSRFELNKRADGNGFTFVFFPGPSFFEDYQRFYGGPLPQPSAQPAQPPVVQKPARPEDEGKRTQPIQIVHYFYTRLYGTDDLDDLIFSDKEVAQAAKLLAKLSYEEVRAFVDYSLREAQHTAYNVKTFSGIQQYYPAFLAHRKATVQAQAQEKQRQEEAFNRQLEDRYRTFRQERLTLIRQALPADKLQALEAKIRARVEAEHPQAIGRHILVRVQVDQRLAERYAIPSFDDWKAEILKSRPSA